MADGCITPEAATPCRWPLRTNTGSLVDPLVFGPLVLVQRGTVPDGRRAHYRSAGKTGAWTTPRSYLRSTRRLKATSATSGEASGMTTAG